MRRALGKDSRDGREGDKVMGPLFPRLHVNDTTLKGGGPWAPLRNKMAFYEQFSVPSAQRFNASTAQAHRPAGFSYAASSASAGQVQQRPMVIAASSRGTVTGRRPAYYLAAARSLGEVAVGGTKSNYVTVAALDRESGFDEVKSMRFSCGVVSLRFKLTFLASSITTEQICVGRVHKDPCTIYSQGRRLVVWSCWSAPVLFSLQATIGYIHVYVFRLAVAVEKCLLYAFFPHNGHPGYDGLGLPVHYEGINQSPWGKVTAWISFMLPQKDNCAHLMMRRFEGWSYERKVDAKKKKPRAEDHRADQVSIRDYRKMTRR